MDTTMQELINFLKEASPQAWAILLKQVYVEAYSLLIWIVVLLVIGITLNKLVFYLYNKKLELDKDNPYQDDFDGMIVGVVSGIFSITAYIITIGLLIDFVQRLYNPEFFVIKYILTNIIK